MTSCQAGVALTVLAGRAVTRWLRAPDPHDYLPLQSFFCRGVNLII